jgi:glutaryl-CoA dehydrogenase
MSNPAATDSTDFYAREALLEDDEHPFLHNVRDSMKSEVQPTLNHHWQPGTFPTAIVNGYPQRDRAGLADADARNRGPCKRAPHG